MPLTYLCGKGYRVRSLPGVIPYGPATASNPLRTPLSIWFHPILTSSTKTIYYHRHGSPNPDFPSTCLRVLEYAQRYLNLSRERAAWMLIEIPRCEEAFETVFSQGKIPEKIVQKYP